MITTKNCKQSLFDSKHNGIKPKKKRSRKKLTDSDGAIEKEM